MLKYGNVGIQSRGAKERTLHEFQQLANVVGFASLALITTIDFLSMLEFT
jgi:hypothetical protein